LRYGNETALASSLKYTELWLCRAHVFQQAILSRVIESDQQHLSGRRASGSPPKNFGGE
jgi:hypothetical protein